MGVNPKIHIEGNVAWVLDNEEFTAQQGEKTVKLSAAATHIFVKKSGKWSIAKDLQGQEGVKRITSYDNYLDSSPQRFIEFEFDTMEDAIKYFENPTIKSILDKSVAMSINYHLNVLSLREDYNKN